MTDTKKAYKVKDSDQVPRICYPVQFQKDKSKDVLALLNFGSKINAMTLAYTAQLGLQVQKINLIVQKIVGSSLAIYSMIIAGFQVFDKLDRFLFF